MTYTAEKVNLRFFINNLDKPTEDGEKSVAEYRAVYELATEVADTIDEDLGSQREAKKLLMLVNSLDEMIQWAHSIQADIQSYLTLSTK